VPPNNCEGTVGTAVLGVSDHQDEMTGLRDFGRWRLLTLSRTAGMEAQVSPSGLRRSGSVGAATMILL